ncbi:FAD-dependent monooxygenase [Streptomyces sp. NPDC091268]|uniref:FAD-dependent monooxygenase n=1 Tax=Streptomyces sp. NPDC091268 TaxID=3365979 RepID=UPI0037F857B8
MPDDVRSPRDPVPYVRFPQAQGEGTMHAQVVVVGGGPVGMLVAAELAGYGIDTVVLEERSAVSERPKATTLHARAVQCLARRGLLPEAGGPADPRGAAAGAFHFAGLPGLVITAPESEPTPILKYPQAQLEHLFEAQARARGARVLRRHRVTGIRQQPHEVRLAVEGPAGPVSCTARYLVAADGARGTVRELAGIPSDVHPATVSALMGLVRLADPHSLEPGWHRTARGHLVAKRGPDGATHIRTVNCTAPHGNRHLPLSLAELREEVSWIAGREIAMDAPRWLSRFSDFARLARTFREQRILLAGDAAHVHFPIGGQGLSTGLLDALNLGWKLAFAVLGRAGAGLLDTYDLERRPAAQRVIDNTRAQLALMRPVPETDALGTVFEGLLAADRDTGYLRGLISAQDTVYPAHTARPSAWEGRFLRNRVLTTACGGTDVIELLRDGRPLLLLLGEAGGRYREEARDWAGTVRLLDVMPTPDLPYDALLVRPDGYIAWAPDGGPLSDALATYLGEPARTGPAERAVAMAPRTAGFPTPHPG